MERREFIGFLGSAAVWPLMAHAQQATTPVIGLLVPSTLEAEAAALAAFRKGLGATGYVEGHNVAIEYRVANGEAGRLPALVADLVRHRVAVIVAVGNNGAVAA